ncbi:MAG: DNA internalization-related competence protein ComEC/Rec2 [Negativicutes bacterium]|jgi:competence protein ComEC
MAKNFEIIAGAYFCGLLLAAFASIKLNTSAVAAIFLVAAILSSVFFLIGKRKYLLLILFSTVLLLTGVWRYNQAISVSPDDVSNYNGRQVELIAKIVDIPSMVLSEKGGYAVSFSADAEKLFVNGSEQAVSGGVAVYATVETEAAIPKYGETVQMTVKLLAPLAYKNPGQTSYSEYLRQKGITSTARMEHFEVIGSGGWLARFGRWQQRAKLAAIGNMPAEIAAVYNGVLFGGSTNIPKHIQNEFKQTGIVHILSVSGTHISLVAATVFWLFNIFRVPRRHSALIAIVTAWLYVFFAGFVAAAVRSALMASFALFAIAISDESSIKRSLWLAALIILLCNPLNLTNVGFLLSLSATFGIAYFYKDVYRCFVRIMPQKLAQILAFTIVAQAGLLPFAAYFFNGISLMSLAANVLVTPIIDVVLIVGLFSALMPLMIVKKSALFVAMLALKIAIYINAWLAKLPGGRIYFPALTWWQGLSYYALLLFGTMRRQTIVLFGSKLEKSTVLIGGAALWLAIVLICILIPTKLQIHFIDVGEGDAALVITPHHHAVLLDCGGNYKKSDESFDIGERVVAPYLLHYGVRQLDAVVLSHEHIDHAGGLPGVSAAVTVNRVIKTDNATSFNIDGVEFDFTEVVSGESNNQNEHMLITRVSSGELAALITGDLGIKGEQALIKRKENINANILKIGHHGSKTSTSEEFLQAVQPEYAVVSVGRDNRYGHPAAAVVKNIEKSKAQIFRTDINGAVIFEASKAGWCAKPFISN